MKKVDILSIFLLFLTITSCVKNEPEDDKRHFSSENEWIHDIMKNNYLFRDEMPSRPDFSKEPIDFYNSLLSTTRDMNKKKTTHYSRIELKEGGTRAVTESKGYGFQLIRYQIGSTILLRVLYIIPGSPAEKAGLKRGDFISEINDKQVKNTSTTDDGTIMKMTVKDDLYAQERTITMGDPIVIDDKPLLMNKIIEEADRKIAYVVYNHFTPGVGDDLTKDRRYDDELCEMSRQFADAGVNEMVLDLRYNGGGQISCAQLLSTIIAPASAMGKIFCTLKDVNDKVTPYRFEESVIRNGRNLNLKRLYVLTTEFSASASELVINCLRPFMDVIIIGDVTEGKNVGSRDFRHVDFNHVLKPIYCYVYNSRGEANYNNGFTPDYYHQDLGNLSKQYSLGDPRETMLKMAINSIMGRSVKSLSEKGTTDLKKTFHPKETELIIDTE